MVSIVRWIEYCERNNIRGRLKGLTKQMLADDSIGGLVLIIAYKHTV